MEDNEASALLRNMLRRAVGDGRQEFWSFLLPRLALNDPACQSGRVSSPKCGPQP
jgi:hypothetical protein